MKRLAGGVVLAVAVAWLWTAQCSGPMASVVETQVEPPDAPGAPFRLAATVQNGGSGHGQVSLTFRLRDKASGRTYENQEKASLDEHETTVITSEIHAPLGQYEPDVQVEYPPR
jgi:hypothetical protein